MKHIIIQDNTFDFAIGIIRLYQFLTDSKKEYVLAKQVLRSGTSIGANVEEAAGGVSKADFKNKLSISYKEARETLYWLRLLHATDYLTKKMFDSLFNDCDEIARILYTIIYKSKY